MLAWIVQVEEGLPKADAIVFLDVPQSHSKRLLSGRKSKIRGVKKDIHEADDAFSKKVYANYLRLSRDNKWIVVKCTQKGALRRKEDIAAEVYRVLAKRKVL